MGMFFKGEGHDPAELDEWNSDPNPSTIRVERPFDLYVRDLAGVLRTRKCLGDADYNRKLTECAALLVAAWRARMDGYVVGCKNGRPT